MNQERATDILKLLSKISSLPHFSQWLADYFTQDHALEPALTVLCGILRINLDVSGVLAKRAATFMSLAQPIEKHRSAENHNAYRRRNFPKRVHSVRTRTQSGFSFVFKRNGCKDKNYSFKHKCARCKSSYLWEFYYINDRRKRSRSAKSRH